MESRSRAVAARRSPCSSTAVPTALPNPLEVPVTNHTRRCASVFSVIGPPCSRARFFPFRTAEQTNAARTRRLFGEQVFSALAHLPVAVLERGAQGFVDLGAVERREGEHGAAAH